jgi:glycosyltransferase involved in cell wall biosynthesis
MAHRISVVVNTYNRAESLRVTLRSFEQLDNSDFEVVVVNGPSTDSTTNVMAEFAGRIKVGSTPHRNLSESRNIGVALAAGDIVAFIDDDAYPDPAWLDRVDEAYADEVAGVGGPLYDHTGVQYQVRYSTVDRFGRANDDHAFDPTPYFNLPYAMEFAHIIGANSSFRRDRLVEIGGFDEEFEYFLDETDVCVRMIDRGWVIREIDDGVVYHKFLPSDVRGTNRAIRNRYSVLKNTVYFALKHAQPHYSFADVCRRMAQFAEDQGRDVRRCVDHGLLDLEDLRRFEADVPSAFDAALAAYRRGNPRYPDPSTFAAPPPFLRFATRRAREDKLHICCLTQEWPPMQLSGIGRFTLSFATGLAERGHIVHVLTRGQHHDRVDLDSGVWVHRKVVTPHMQPAAVDAPAHIWDHSASMLDELRRIHAHRHIDIVQVPNWDSEGVAVILDGAFKTAVWLATPLAIVRALDPVMNAQPVSLNRMEELERLCYTRATALLAYGSEVVSEIEERYGISVPSERLSFVTHGIPDVPPEMQPVRPPGDVINVLFVGRLEPRKGIDTLLACVPCLCDRFTNLVFTIVGRDDIRGPDGTSYRRMFEESDVGRRLAQRVTFTGWVDDKSLLGYYAACDVFVAPSRYESFGQILVEAMRLSKPVVGCRVGGMADVVEDGGNGYLIDAGNVAQLGTALNSLVASSEQRARFGARSRQIYEERFTVARMVDGFNRAYDRITGRATFEAHAVSP